jgi:hypothetical protein
MKKTKDDVVDLIHDDLGRVKDDLGDWLETLKGSADGAFSSATQKASATAQKASATAQKAQEQASSKAGAAVQVARRHSTAILMGLGLVAFLIAGAIAAIVTHKSK